MKRVYRLFKDRNIQLVTRKKQVNILWFPIIETDDELYREVARVVWYVNPIVNKVDKIVMLVSSKYTHMNILKLKIPEYVDAGIHKLFSAFLDKIIFVNEFQNIQPMKYDLVVEWKHLNDTKRKQAFYPYYINAAVMQNQFEANQIMKISNILLGKNQKKDNYTKLINLLKKLKNQEYKSIYVFGSGPSLQNFDTNTINYEESCSIICNSVVKNLDLLKKINPKIIVATDTVFHAGYSKYAQEFRQAVVNAMDLIDDLFFLVPLRDYMLYIKNLPKRFNSRIIGIKGKKIQKYNLDLLKKQYLKSTSNVLTFFLLPIAASLSKQIKIVGFDGKAPEDQNIFWQYDKKSQFLETINYTKEAHPAFYKVDYKQYYQTHCEEVREIVDMMQKKKIYIDVVGISYVPALKALRLD